MAYSEYSYSRPTRRDRTHGLLRVEPNKRRGDCDIRSLAPTQPPELAPIENVERPQRQWWRLVGARYASRSPLGDGLADRVGATIAESDKSCTRSRQRTTRRSSRTWCRLFNVFVSKYMRARS